MDIFGILTLIGGIALFLFGMHVMSDSLESLSGSALERILARATNTKFKALLVGMLVTGVIQSSSATTVMSVGFVNAGIMKLEQVVGIILGANIGTTITNWIFSLIGIQSENFFLNMLKPENFTPILAVIGVIFIMTSKSDKKKQLGTIFLGFTVLMYGMELMSDAVRPLASNPQFSELLIKFSNPLWGILAGMVLTAIIQSSAASIGMIQALAMSTLIPYSVAMPLVMGNNIGTTGTALISSVGTNKNARRAALIHFYFNVAGTVLYVVGFYAVDYFVDFKFMDEMVTPAGLALVNTIFNVVPVLVIYPLSDWLIKLANWTVRNDPGETETQNVRGVRVDDRLLVNPSFALAQCRTQVNELAESARDSLLTSLNLFERYDKDRYDIVKKYERTVDEYEDALGTYLIKIGAKSGLTQKESGEITKLMHCIGDFERISDHAASLADTAKAIQKKSLVIPPNTSRELKILFEATEEILTTSTSAFLNGDLPQARNVAPLNLIVRALKEEMRKRQIRRLRKGKIAAETGFLLSDVLNDTERVAGHSRNIAACLIQTAENSYDTHAYIENLAADTANTEFRELVGHFSAKYTLAQPEYEQQP
ncbi:MAG: Na/Pi cotransporter family protein [Oscillospiraceae bacterium]|jgi:phosphate:Na+ symporter|nr:Na/Pi cotransporter family protein [Oscillospiraceae bacterium]